MKIVHVNEHKLDTLSFIFQVFGVFGQFCLKNILCTITRPNEKKQKNKQSFREIVAKTALREELKEETERKSENIAEQENKTAPGVLCCVWSSLHVELYWNADIIAG